MGNTDVFSEQGVARLRSQLSSKAQKTLLDRVGALPYKGKEEAYEEVVVMQGQIPFSQLRGVARLTWAAFFFTVLVAVNGVFVRASESGAGCGSTWPLCFNQVFPQFQAWDTVVEYVHRALSGLAFLLVIFVAWRLGRALGWRAQATQAALVTVFLMVTESLAGASLVLFDWVVHDLSWGRVMIMPIHLTNTHLLIASLAVTAWMASGGRVAWNAAEVRGWLRRMFPWWALVWVVSGLGALTALYASVEYWREQGGMPAEYQAPAALIETIRWAHPVLGVVLTLGITWTLVRWRLLHKTARPWALLTLGSAWLQLAVGGLNWWADTPTTVQLVHLLLAYGIWIGWLFSFLETVGHRAVGLPRGVEARPVAASGAD